MELFPVRLLALDLGHHSRGASSFVAISTCLYPWANGEIVLNRQASPKMTLTALNVGHLFSHIQTDEIPFFPVSDRFRKFSPILV